LSVLVVDDQGDGDGIADAVGIGRDMAEEGVGVWAERGSVAGIMVARAKARMRRFFINL
jgi:hypothetical protein